MILDPNTYIEFLTSHIKPFAHPVAGRKEVVDASIVQILLT